MAVQVAHILRKRLRESYSEGGRLPGEHEIASELGVSRGTVRQALSVLQQEGVITRQQGSGTYANPHVLQISARIDTAYEFSQLIESAGFEAKIDAVKVQCEPAGEEAAARLGLETGDPFLVAHKVFLASGQPAIYVIEQLPVALIKADYAEAELAEPIFQFLASRCHVNVEYILSEIIPALAEGPLVGLLQLAAGQPVLKFVEVFYSSSNKPLALATIYFRDPLIRFHALRKMSLLPA